MNRLTAMFIAALLAAGLQTTRAQQSNAQADKLLASAQHKATVDGDLKGAIDEYKKIVASAGANRALAAQALVQMAECYQKLGDPQAKTIYERIVREFADRTEEAAAARARIGDKGGSTTKLDRAVWTWPERTKETNMNSHVSADGALLVYAAAADGRLMVHDIVKNVDRSLTPAVPRFAKYAGRAVLSRDGKQVVYQWWEDDENRMGLRIGTLSAGGLQDVRQIVTFSDVRGEDWFDWSPDRKWLAASLRRKDGTGQIALISVADGSLRVLRSMDWKVPTRIFFSPDSRYIAYDRPASDTSTERDVFVMTLDGQRDIPAVIHSANDTVMGWSPDGARLLFASDRTGSIGLWAIRLVDGKVQAPPELLKADIGASASLGMTDAGTLYVRRRVSGRDLAIARVDLDAGILLGPPVSFTQGFVNGASVSNWSPDGKYLAYKVGACDNDCLAIRSVETGQVRLLPPNLRDINVPSWSPDGRWLLARGTDRDGQRNIFKIDAQTGDYTPVVVGGGLSIFADWSLDGAKVYFTRQGVLLERDLGSGTERTINRDLQISDGSLAWLKLSPDRQSFVVLRTDRSTKAGTLLLVPTAGGPARELLTVNQPDTIGPSYGWTHDSHAILFTKENAVRKELWLAQISGGAPRKLDIDPALWSEGAGQPGEIAFSLSPDGRSLAFQTGKTVFEVWALENFLPPSSTKKQ